MNPTEKLIQLVQQHPCLYKSSDKDYRNNVKKDLTWQLISKELKQNRDVTKTKWKNLKDGYTKYKKENINPTGQKKYLNWVWGPYLEFLDNGKISNLCNLSSLAETVYLPDASPDTLSTSIDTPLAKKTKYDSEVSEDDIEKVLSFLKNRKENDAVELLFASYAETFKKLKTRTQAEVKLKLAQIFTEAELKDFDDNNENPISVATDEGSKGVYSNQYSSYTRIGTTSDDEQKSNVTTFYSHENEFKV